MSPRSRRIRYSDLDAPARAGDGTNDSEYVTVTYSFTERIRLFGVGIEVFHDSRGVGDEGEMLYEVRIKTPEWERLGRPMTLEVRAALASPEART